MTRRPPPRYVLAWIDGGVTLLHLRTGRVTHPTLSTYRRKYRPTADYRAAYQHANGEK